MHCQCRRWSGHRFDPWSGRSPEEGHGNPLQYSCLENPTDRGAWWATVHGVAKSWTWLKQLSTHALWSTSHADHQRRKVELQLSFIPKNYSFSENLSEWVRSQDWTELILWERLREPNIKLKHQIAQILWGDVRGVSEPPLFFPSREFSADLALSQRASSK